MGEFVEKEGNPMEKPGNPACSLAPDLRRLAESLGIELEYTDGRGKAHAVTTETLEPILQALDPSLHTGVDVHHVSERFTEERWARPMEPVLLFFPHLRQPVAFQVNLPVGETKTESIFFVFEVINETGKSRVYKRSGSVCPQKEQAVIGLKRYVSLTVTLPCKPPLGYHTLRMEANVAGQLYRAESLIVSAPLKCYAPKSSRKHWGIGLQLYSVRSGDNWGIGDFGDLKKMIGAMGKRLGADTIGLQPLNASTPGLASPYSPSSRLFWNPLYLDLTKVKECQNSPALRRRLRSKKFLGELKRLRESPLIQYDKIGSLKASILATAFQVFRRTHMKNQTSRALRFARFMAEGGEPLIRFCIFQVLHEKFKGIPWRNWPQSFQNPESQAVQDVLEKYKVQVQYFAYVQWLCALQLSELKGVADRSGLSLGLYYDLPVGIHPDGADAWAFQDQLAEGVSVGAPPDSFNLLGQSWGLVSPSPPRLRAHGYGFWRETLRKNMQFAGVLRIDHALGLFRMFWVPEGKTGQDGVYVRTKVDELLAILALESVRHKVLVVGEDLGTLTPAIRHTLERAGLLSYRLLFFERREGGAFLEPERFPSQALVAATTHDLPTLCGYWIGRDITIKEQGNMYPHPEDLERDRSDRKQDREWLWAALRQRDLVKRESCPPALSMEEMKAVYRYLAACPSRLLIVQVEDLLAETDTPNLPGAPDSVYPSWRLKLSRLLEDWLFASETLQFAQTVSKARRS